MRDLMVALKRLKVGPVSNLFVEELVQIQSSHLCFFTDAQSQAGNVLEDEQQDARHHEAVGGDGTNLCQLLAYLDAVAIDSARVQRRAIEGRDGLVGEDARHEGSHHAAHRVQLEHFQPFVNVQPVVEVLQTGTHDRSQEANHCCEPDAHITCCRRDADQSRNGTFAGTDDTELAFGADVVDQYPAQHAAARRGVGVECRIHGTNGRVQRGAAVESCLVSACVPASTSTSLFPSLTEPAEPDQDRSEEDQGRVVRLLLGLGADTPSLAQNERVCQTSPSRRDVHGSTSSKVERGQRVQPAVTVPGPTRNGAVDDRGPEEGKDQ